MFVVQNEDSKSTIFVLFLYLASTYNNNLAQAGKVLNWKNNLTHLSLTYMYAVHFSSKTTTTYRCTSL